MPKRKKEVEDSGSEFEQGEEEEEVELGTDLEEEEQEQEQEPLVESDTDDVVVVTSSKRKKVVEQTEAQLDAFEETDTFKRFNELLSQAIQFELVDGYGHPTPVPKPSKGTPKKPKKSQGTTSSQNKAEAIFWDFSSGPVRCPFTKCDKEFGTYAGIKYHMEKTPHSLHLLFETDHQVPESHQPVLEELKSLSSEIIGEVYPLQVETKRYTESLSKTLAMTVLMDGSTMSEKKLDSTAVGSPKAERARRDKLIAHRTTTGYYGLVPSKTAIFRRFTMPQVQNFVYPSIKHYVTSSREYMSVM
jgi:hypothetical protein